MLPQGITSVFSLGCLQNRMMKQKEALENVCHSVGQFVLVVLPEDL